MTNPHFETLALQQIPFLGTQDPFCSNPMLIGKQQRALFVPRGECTWPRADAAVHQHNRACAAVIHLHAPCVSQLLLPSLLISPCALQQTSLLPKNYISDGFPAIPCPGITKKMIDITANLKAGIPANSICTRLER